MTVVNLISGAVYSKDQPLKSRIQGWLLALVFLLLLYNSPSGLVLYWTCNNIYSLVKNILMKLSKHPACIISCVCIVFAAVLCAYMRKMGTLTYISLAVILLIVIICVISFINSFTNIKLNIIDNFTERIQADKWLLFAEEIFMTVLMGLFIPLSVISSSASEFVIETFDPLSIPGTLFTIYAGFFIVWFSIFYFLMPENPRKIFQAVFAGVCVAAVVNFLFFANKLGKMTPMLVYENEPDFSLIENAVNFLVYILIVAAVIALAVINYKVCARVICIATVCLSVICVMNFTNARSDMKHYYANMDKNVTEDIVTLSMHGNNVVILMLDRAIGGYLPYILDEKPKLKTQFDGFVYYPNTVSFGGHTNLAVAPVYGGYEYTPDEMNKRTEETLESKQNEALKMLPKLFSDNGYNVTVCDPPYAGYKWDPDLTIYDDLNNVDAYTLVLDYWTLRDVGSAMETVEMQCRNFLYYSMSKVMPVFIQERIYNNGNYFTTARKVSNSYTQFMHHYNVMDNLDKLVKIDKDDTDNLFFMKTSITHTPAVLSTPDYVPEPDVDEEEELRKQTCVKVHDGEKLINEEKTQIKHYAINVASLQVVAKWIDYLKKEDVYDNTRIIIVADHGGDLHQFEKMQFDFADVQEFNPLLLYKDFNARGEIVTDESFMTNADTPFLAVKDLIEDAKNPYTQQTISMDEKSAHPQYVTLSGNWELLTEGETVFDTGDEPWYSVHDNIFERDNWELYKEAEH